MKKTKTMTYKRFPAKILLFGEYLLMRGATALSLPFNLFGGHWAWSGNTDKPPMQGRLSEFAKSDVLRMVPGFDIIGFKEELERGIWLRSNIPSGYGLGSSGVVCAAVYDRYCHAKTDNLSELQSHLSQMEAFFHERSSGIDPLTSYLSQPVVVRNNNEISTLPQFPTWAPHFQIYLLDTRITRSTSKLVHQFMEKLNHPKFSSLVDKYIQDVHEPLANAFLAGNYDMVWNKIAEVSVFQWQYQRFLIPESLDYRWSEGLRSNDYFLKICGAGGGGYSLLFVKDKEIATFLGRLHRLIPLRESFESN